jgi:hypothetical protein
MGMPELLQLRLACNADSAQGVENVLAKFPELKTPERLRLIVGWCAWSERPQALETLLNNGGDPHGKLGENEKPLEREPSEEEKPMLFVLPDKGQAPPIILAGMAHARRSLTLLLSKGVDPRITHKDKNTLLWVCSNQSSKLTSSVQLLLRWGMSPDKESHAEVERAQNTPSALSALLKTYEPAELEKLAKKSRSATVKKAALSHLKEKRREGFIQTLHPPRLRTDHNNDGGLTI